MIRPLDHKNEDTDKTPVAVTHFNWWFHKFKVKVKKGNIREDVSPDLEKYASDTSIRGRMTALPEGKAEHIALNLGVNGKIGNNAYRTRLDKNVTLESQPGAILDASLKNLLLENLRSQADEYMVGGKEELERLLSMMEE